MERTEDCVVLEPVPAKLSGEEGAVSVEAAVPEKSVPVVVAAAAEEGVERSASAAAEDGEEGARAEGASEGEDGSGSAPSNVIALVVETFDGTRVKVEADLSDSVIEIRQVLLESPETCYYTCYHLEFEGQEINDYVLFNELATVLPQNGVLKMAADYYDERAARIHVRRLRDILKHPPSSFDPTYFLKWAQANLTTEEVSAPKDLKPFVSCASKTDTALEELSSLEEKFEDIPTCVESIVFSAWNPPPGPRKLAGDLFYLEIRTLEDHHLFVTASAEGFFLNKSTSKSFDPSPAEPSYRAFTLVEFLNNVSAEFKERFHRILFRRTNKHLFETIPYPFPYKEWTGISSSHSYDHNRAEENALSLYGIDDRGMLRFWNEEYQNCVDSPCESLRDALARDRLRYRIVADFLFAATEGAVAVVEGNIAPLYPMEPKSVWVWVYNNIFFTEMNDGRELLKEYGGRDTHYKLANLDLKALQVLEDAHVKGLHTLVTCLVTYRGRRFSCQGVIPGILHGDQASSLVFGYMDEGSVVEADPEMYDILKTVAQVVNAAERPAKDPKGNVFMTCAGADVKGIRGSDKRLYVLEFPRITPRDSNFPDEKTHIAHVLRPELVQTFLRAKVVQKYLEKKRTEDSKEDPTDDKITIDRDFFVKELESIKFNLNAFTPREVDDGKLGEDKSLIIEASKFLSGTVIPKLVLELKEWLVCPVDSASFSRVFHARGVNLRYLGMIANLLEDSPRVQHYCIREMIARTAKHMLNNYLREPPAPLGSKSFSSTRLDIVLISFLNTFLGCSGFGASFDFTKKAKKGKKPQPRCFDSAALWSELRESCFKRFNFSLSENLSEVLDSADRLSLLRSLCKSCGIQMSSRSFEFSSTEPFVVEDILDLFPVVKHYFPSTAETKELLNSGYSLVNKGNFLVASDLLMKGLHFLHQVGGPLQSEAVSCYSSLALISYDVGDYIEAVEQQQRAVVISEKVFGKDHAETAYHHGNLALYLYFIRRYEESFQHLCRCIVILKIVSGFGHPDTASALMNLAVLLQDLGKAESAVKVLLEALSSFKVFLPEASPQIAWTNHSLALAYFDMGKYRVAVDHEKKARELYSTIFGADSPQVAEANRWLAIFTKHAVCIETGAVAKLAELGIPRFASIWNLMGTKKQVLLHRPAPLMDAPLAPTTRISAPISVPTAAPETSSSREESSSPESSAPVEKSEQVSSLSRAQKKKMKRKQSSKKSITSRPEVLESFTL